MADVSESILKRTLKKAGLGRLGGIGGILSLAFLLNEGSSLFGERSILDRILGTPDPDLQAKGAATEQKALLDELQRARTLEALDARAADTGSAFDSLFGSDDELARTQSTLQALIGTGALGDRDLPTFLQDVGADQLDSPLLRALSGEELDRFQTALTPEPPNPLHGGF